MRYRFTVCQLLFHARKIRRAEKAYANGSSWFHMLKINGIRTMAAAHALSWMSLTKGWLGVTRRTYTRD
jgi:hypothetical protein